MSGFQACKQGQQFGKALAVLAGGIITCAAPLQAAELSFLSGLYRSESNETAGVDTGSKRTIDLGGRYAAQLDGKMYWFGQGMLSLKSYEKGDAGPAPSSSTSLNLGGGVRYYFGKLSENFSAFTYGLGEYRADKDAATTGAGTVEEREKNGLYYGAAFGIRCTLGTEFFVDFETPLFDSALFATEKTETKTSVAGGPTTTVESETKRMELYASTTGAFSKVVVALGMRL